jgi:hypothetical protein
MSGRVDAVSAATLTFTSRRVVARKPVRVDGVEVSARYIVNGDIVASRCEQTT